MVPSLYMTGIGKSCYKGESFKKAKSAFSNDAWSLIERASQIRSNWEDEEGVFYKGNAVPSWVKTILKEDYIEEGYKLIKEALYNIERDK